MNSKKKNFRQDIIESIESIDKDKEILNLYEILNEVSKDTGIDLSTIRKNKEYYQICVDGFKKHICNQFVKNCNFNNYDEKINVKNLKKENNNLKERVNFLELALSKKINTPDLDDLKQFKDDVLEYFKNDKKFIIKDDKVYYGNAFILSNPIIGLLIKKG